MTNNTLLDAIGRIEERYIVEAKPDEQKTRRIPIGRLGILAACLALIVSISYLCFPEHTDSLKELPMLSVEIGDVSMGFEGYQAHNIDELVNGNPWNSDTAIKTLPVFQNVQYSRDGIPTRPDLERMKERLLEIAARIGMDTASADIEVSDNYPDEETIQKVTEKYAERGEKVPLEFFAASEVSLQWEGVEIEVSSDLTATLRFDPALSLPDGYRFSEDADYKDLTSASEYLKSEFAEFLSMENPTVDISGGDYDINGIQQYQIAFYDMCGELSEQIVNYNFNRVTFSSNDDGELWIVRVYLPDLTQKLGDYPIIGEKKAEELLAQGHYITTVPVEFPGREYMRKTELVYRTSGEVYMPYYRIYVELPDMAGVQTGLPTYGAYYVPAVEADYLSNMPVWDGSFN